MRSLSEYFRTAITRDVASVVAYRRPLGYQQIKVTTPATAILTVPILPGFVAGEALIIAEANAIRYRDDGVAPTSSVGMPIATGVIFDYTGELYKIIFTSQVGTAIINVCFYV